MATRNNTKPTKTKTTPMAGKPVKAVAQPSEIPAGFLERSAQRSAENEQLLKESEVFTKAEYDALRKAMIAAYKRVSETTAPVVHMTPEVLVSFLSDGEYKTFGATGKTGGSPGEAERLDYTGRTYGYKNLEGCEKYGTIPVEQVNRESPIHSIPLQDRFCSRYGSVEVILKPEVGSRTTMNLMDSGHQWGLDGSWKKNTLGGLFPVPYRVDDPEKFVGCLMAPPTQVEMKDIKSGDEQWLEYTVSGVRSRNFKLLELLEGRDGHEYIEAHVHGAITPGDIDTIVYVKELVATTNGWAAAVKKATELGIKVVSSDTFVMPLA